MHARSPPPRDCQRWPGSRPWTVTLQSPLGGARLCWAWSAAPISAGRARRRPSPWGVLGGAHLRGTRAQGRKAPHRGSCLAAQHRLTVGRARRRRTPRGLLVCAPHRGCLLGGAPHRGACTVAPLTSGLARWHPSPCVPDRGGATLCCLSTAALRRISDAVSLLLPAQRSVVVGQKSVWFRDAWWRGDGVCN
jgi:hypothetical protein